MSSRLSRLQPGPVPSGRVLAAWVPAGRVPGGRFGDGRGSQPPGGRPPAGDRRHLAGRSTHGAGRSGSAVGIIGAIAAVSAALRSGAPADRAWRRGFGVHVDGLAPTFADLLNACEGDRGAAGVLVAAGRLAATTGAPLADVLDRVVAAMAQDEEAAGQRAAAMAGPRATARVLAWLPASGVVLGLVLGADPAAVLLDGGPGTMLLVLGALLTTIGRVWSRRCVQQALAAGAAG